MEDLQAVADGSLTQIQAILGFSSPKPHLKLGLYKVFIACPRTIQPKCNMEFSTPRFSVVLVLVQ